MVVLRTPDEIEKMKRPNQVVASILNELVSMCRPGVNTLELEERSRELVGKYKVKSAF